jgi:hypothetical protein
LFHSARWKAYLQEIRDNAKNNPGEETDTISGLFHKLHSESFLCKEESNGHQAAAEEHLKRSEELMKDCTDQVDALEETLANTPKPSLAIDWGHMTLRDMMGESRE